MVNKDSMQKGFNFLFIWMGKPLIPCFSLHLFIFFALSFSI